MKDEKKTWQFASRFPSSAFIFPPSSFIFSLTPMPRCRGLLGRMKDERWKMKKRPGNSQVVFLLPPSSFRLHPLSFPSPPRLDVEDCSEGGRMKDEGWKMKDEKKTWQFASRFPSSAFIFPPSSFIFFLTPMPRCRGLKHFPPLRSCGRIDSQYPHASM